jgi:hypothetical protein
MAEAKKARAKPTPFAKSAKGACLCGAVEIEISVPARSAWHDHGRASRLAHGAAYATYVGAYKSRFRVTRGAKTIARFVEEETGNARSFCARCGTPLAYERARAKDMINVPRALFAARTGREPLYHIRIEELQEWAYTGEKLVPLKGFPGVVWERAKRKKRAARDPLFE